MSKGGTKAQTQSTNPKWFDDAGSELWNLAKGAVFQPSAPAPLTTTFAPSNTTTGPRNPKDVNDGVVTPFNPTGAVFTKPGQNNAGPLTVSNSLTGTMKPYEAYTGQRVAGPSANQAAASSMALSASGGTGDYFTNAKNWLSAATNPFGKTFSTSAVTPTMVSTGKFDQASATDYMNPYIKMALDPAQSELSRAADIARLSQNAGQVSRRSFGGSRQAIADAEINRNYMDKSRQLWGEGYASAFQNAMAAFMQDQTRKLQADTSNQDVKFRGDIYNEDNRFRSFESERDQKNREAQNYLQAAASSGNLATQQSNIASQDVERLMKTGAQDQVTQQNLLDWAYQQSQEGKNWDKDQIGWLSGILNGTGAKGSQQTIQKPQDNTVGQLIGAGGTILGGWLSDARLKEDIKTVGWKNGVPVVEFRYKGGDQKYRGVLAQDVLRVHPDAVCEQDGFLAVNYGMINIPFEPIESPLHGSTSH